MMVMDFNRSRDMSVKEKYGNRTDALHKPSRYWVSGDLAAMVETYSRISGTVPSRLMELATISALGKGFHPPTADLADRILSDLADGNVLHWYEPIKYIPGHQPICAISVGGRREATKAQVQDDRSSKISGFELWEYEDASIRREALSRCISLAWKISRRIDNVIIHRNNIIVGVLTDTEWESLGDGRMIITDAGIHCGDGNDPTNRDYGPVSQLIGRTYIDRSPMSSNPITILRK